MFLHDVQLGVYTKTDNRDVNAVQLDVYTRTDNRDVNAVALKSMRLKGHDVGGKLSNKSRRTRRGSVKNEQQERRRRI